MIQTLPRDQLELRAAAVLEAQQRGLNYRRSAQAVTARLLPNPVEWIQSHFYIPETKQPIQLPDYQRRALGEALRQENGLFRYSTILWSDRKKSGKTAIAAAVAAWLAFNQDRARIRLVGNDLKQADSRVFGALREAIELNPKWKAQVRLINNKALFPNGSLIESVPIDPAGEAGGNDDMVEWTELWAAKHGAHQKMWTEMTLSPTKFRRSFTWIDTYAGFTGESPILEPLYEQSAKKDGEGKTQGIKLWDDLDVYVNGRLFVLWNETAYCPWQTPEYYAEQATRLGGEDSPEFLRIHKNQWGSSVQGFVPIAWWDSCQLAKLREVSKREPMVVILDAGVSNDSFGVMMLSYDDKEDAVELRYARDWTPPKGGTIQFFNPSNPLDRDYPEGEICWLISNFNVIEVTYDPYQLHNTATRLGALNKAHFEPFNQGQDRLVADKQLKDLIMQRRIRHTGETNVRQHIMNANAKTEGDKLRLVKKSETQKIDLAVCASMGSARILKLLRRG